MNKIVVIGKSGQLAHELAHLDKRVICLGRDDIDITHKQTCHEVLSSLNPDAIINASAYTAVDKAESDKDNTYLLNSEAVKHLAEYCANHSLFMVHVSTDYVFAGLKGAPYKVNDPLSPQGVYGASKAEGEKALREILPDTSAILRTSWVYSSHGNNFVKTMLRLMTENPQLSVIDDQIGSPTWAKGLAKACIEAASKQHAGIYHWSDEGVCSWYDFVCTIQELAMGKGMLDTAIPILPIPTSQYPTPAARPHYSVMDKTLTRDTFTTELHHWRGQLSRMLDELKQEN